MPPKKVKERSSGPVRLHITMKSNSSQSVDDNSRRSSNASNPINIDSTVLRSHKRKQKTPSHSPSLMGDDDHSRRSSSVSIHPHTNGSGSGSGSGLSITLGKRKRNQDSTHGHADTGTNPSGNAVPNSNSNLNPKSHMKSSYSLRNRKSSPGDQEDWPAPDDNQAEEWRMSDMRWSWRQQTVDDSEHASEKPSLDINLSNLQDLEFNQDEELIPRIKLDVPEIEEPDDEVIDDINPSLPHVTRSSRRTRGFRAETPLIDSNIGTPMPGTPEIGADAERNKANRKLPGRRRAPHANPHVEADLRRQLILKTNFRNVIKNVKPVLDELAKRSIEKLEQNHHAHENVPEYQHVMSELDLYLERRLKAIDAVRDLGVKLLDDQYEQGKDYHNLQYQAKVEEIRERYINDIIIEYIEIHRQNEEEDEDVTDDENGELGTKRVAASYLQSNPFLDPKYDSRSRLYVETLKYLDNYNSRYYFQSLIQSELENDDHIDKEIMNTGHSHGYIDTLHHENAVLSLNIHTLADAANQVEHVDPFTDGFNALLDAIAQKETEIIPPPADQSFPPKKQLTLEAESSQFILPSATPTSQAQESLRNQNTSITLNPLTSQAERGYSVNPQILKNSVYNEIQTLEESNKRKIHIGDMLSSNYESPRKRIKTEQNDDQNTPNGDNPYIGVSSEIIPQSPQDNQSRRSSIAQSSLPGIKAFKNPFNHLLHPEVANTVNQELQDKPFSAIDSNSKSSSVDERRENDGAPKSVTKSPDISRGQSIDRLSHQSLNHQHTYSQSQPQSEPHGMQPLVYTEPNNLSNSRHSVFPQQQYHAPTVPSIAPQSTPQPVHPTNRPPPAPSAPPASAPSSAPPSVYYAPLHTTHNTQYPRDHGENYYAPPPEQGKQSTHSNQYPSIPIQDSRAPPSSQMPPPQRWYNASPNSQNVPMPSTTAHGGNYHQNPDNYSPTRLSSSYVSREHSPQKFGPPIHASYNAYQPPSPKSSGQNQNYRQPNPSHTPPPPPPQLPPHPPPLQSYSQPHPQAPTYNIPPPPGVYDRQISSNQPQWNSQAQNVPLSPSKGYHSHAPPISPHRPYTSQEPSHPMSLSSHAGISRAFDHQAPTHPSQSSQSPSLPGIQTQQAPRSNQQQTLLPRSPTNVRSPTSSRHQSLAPWPLLIPSYQQPIEGGEPLPSPFERHTPLPPRRVSHSKTASESSRQADKSSRRGSKEYPVALDKNDENEHVVDENNDAQGPTKKVADSQAETLTDAKTMAVEATRAYAGL